MSNEKIGDILKQGRVLLGFTLRQVEDAIGISNGYLSQIENNKIRKPSVSILYKLSSLYRLNLDRLLVAVGLVNESDVSVSKSNSVFGEIKLTPTEEKQIMEYLNFLRYNTKTT